MFDSLERLLKSHCERKHFSLLGPVGDRHGSWEWTFCKKATNLDDLDRFVIASLTSLPKAPENLYEYSMEIWIGAEDGNHFVRHHIDEFRFTEDSVECKSNIIVSRIKQALDRSVSFVNQLTPIDLVDVYLPKKPNLSGKKNQEGGGRSGRLIECDTSSDSDG